MPFGNGIQFDFGNVYLCNPDGDVVAEFSNMKLADIQEFDDTCYTEDPGKEIWGKIDFNREISFTGILTVVPCGFLACGRFCMAGKQKGL